jgi:hypothetical protein
MRSNRPIFAATLLFALAPALAGEPEPAPGVSDRIDALEKKLASQEEENRRIREELEDLRRREIAREEAGEPAPATPAAAPEGESAGSIAERARRLREREGARGGIYAKPFLARIGRAYLGGYMDWEFRDQEGKDQTFRLPRFIPYIYADVTEHVKVAAEIEFEFGGVSEETKGEVKLEFAFVDYVFSDWLALRAGAILVPLGKFNLIHDSPVNDLTDRPLVDRFVIPTTFTEPGIGFYGEIEPFGTVELKYEIYGVNGFRGLVRKGGTFESEFNSDKGLRDGRADFEQDVNNSPSGVGRLAISPMLGIEVGGSAHVGRYDEHAGGLFAWVWAVDATIQFGSLASPLQGLEYQGEAAWARMERNAIAKAAGVPDALWGMYHQFNYHFMFGALRELLPSLFGEESTFTAVLRYDYVDLDENQRTQMLTPGLNFRPTEETVFKLDYQINWEGRSHNRVKDDAFLFSIATYF